MSESLKVVHLSTSDLRGGAARSAYRLHRSMHDKGIDSRLWVMDKLSQDPSVTVWPQQRSFAGLWSRLHCERERRCLEVARASGQLRSVFSPAEVPWPHAPLPTHHVLNVHWIAGFVSHAEVVHYAQYVGPAVWTLHDLNPFTGGCHFPGACNNYREGCGCCPVLSSSRPRDLAYRGWEAKRRSLARVDTDKLHLVAPSRWLAEAARSSALFRRYAVTVIPYGIDLQTYRPLPRDAMRMVLGIRPDARVILVVAAKLSDSRKAGPAFFSALAATVAGWRDTVVVTAGKHPPALADSMPHRALGPIENEAFLAALYSCADIHLMPTMDDNLPNAALETIACGAPIVGYATGGMPDIVGDDEAGVLTPKGDLAALLAAARTLLGDAARLGRLRLAARERAERLFAKELQVARYRALYETAIQPGKEV